LSQKGARDFVPAGSLGVSPNSTTPPRVGARGLRASMETVPMGAEGISAGGHGLSLYALDSHSRGNDKRGYKGFLPAEGFWVSPN
jgi:hypothetical protein